MTSAVPSAKTAALKPATAVASVALKDIHATWLALCAQRLAPQRSEIAPQSFKTHLQQIYMIDVIDAGTDFRFRIGGEAIVRLMGARYSGMLLSELHDVKFHEGMRRMFGYCVISKSALAAGPLRTKHANGEDLDMEVLALPLSEDGMNVTGIFGAFDLQFCNPEAAALAEPPVYGSRARR